MKVKYIFEHISEHLILQKVAELPVFPNKDTNITFFTNNGGLHTLRIVELEYIDHEQVLCIYLEDPEMKGNLHDFVYKSILLTCEGWEEIMPRDSYIMKTSRVLSKKGLNYFKYLWYKLNRFFINLKTADELN